MRVLGEVFVGNEVIALEEFWKDEREVFPDDVFMVHAEYLQSTLINLFDRATEIRRQDCGLRPMADDFLILGGLFPELARLGETLAEVIAAVFGDLEAFGQLLLAEVEGDQVRGAGTQQGAEAFVVRGVTEDEGVHGVFKLLIAEPTQDTECVRAGIQVITDHEKSWRFLTDEQIGLRGGFGDLDLKACHGEVIAQVLASSEVSSDDVGVDEAQRERRDLRSAVAWVHTISGVNRVKVIEILNNTRIVCLFHSRSSFLGS